MNDNDTFMRFMAAWALVHETADEGWKAAVTRGGEHGTGDMSQGPEAFVDGLSAMIAEEKERLKAELAGDIPEREASATDLVQQVDRLRFEVAELRGAIESMNASLEAMTRQGRE